MKKKKKKFFEIEAFDLKNDRPSEMRTNLL